MSKLIHSVRIPSIYGEKTLLLYEEDITQFSDPVDVLTVSAFERNYEPVYRTLIWGLEKKGIHVGTLAMNPVIDLRGICGTWLSKPIWRAENSAGIPARRLACIEFPFWLHAEENAMEQTILKKLAAFFHMLEIASVSGIPVRSIAMPAIGTGKQKIALNMILIPLLREIVAYLLRSKETTCVMLIERSPEKAKILKTALEGEAFTATVASLCHVKTNGAEERAFISYSHKDEGTVEKLCDLLEMNGVETWYSKKSIHDGTYAERIFEAIDHANVFIPVMSCNSMRSYHVLSEVNLAFNRLTDTRRILPLFIDHSPIRPAFEYYLNTFECMYAIGANQDETLREFALRVKQTT